MIYLAAGYAIFWVVSFVLIYSMVSRQRTLHRELEMLKQIARQEQEAEEI